MLTSEHGTYQLRDYQQAEVKSSAPKKTLEELLPVYLEEFFSPLAESHQDVLSGLIEESTKAFQSDSLNDFLNAAENRVDPKVFEALVAYVVMVAYATNPDLAVQLGQHSSPN